MIPFDLGSAKKVIRFSIESLWKKDLSDHNAEAVNKSGQWVARPHLSYITWNCPVLLSSPWRALHLLGLMVTKESSMKCMPWGRLAHVSKYEVPLSKGLGYRITGWGPLGTHRPYISAPVDEAANKHTCVLPYGSLYHDTKYNSKHTVLDDR